GDRRIDVVDIECQMVAADVAVAGLAAVLIRCGIFEDLEIRSVAAAQESEPLHYRARMDVEMLLHPVAIGLERAALVERLAADDVDEECSRFVQIRHGEADMVGAGEPRHAVFLLAVIGCKVGCLWHPRAPAEGITPTGKGAENRCVWPEGIQSFNKSKVMLNEMP